MSLPNGIAPTLGQPSFPAINFRGYSLVMILRRWNNQNKPESVSEGERAHDALCANRGQAPQNSKMAEQSVVHKSGIIPPFLNFAVPDPGLRAKCVVRPIP